MLSLGPGGDLRPAGHRQLRPRRALHDRRLRGLDRPREVRPELLVRADAGAAGGRRARRRDRAHAAASSSTSIDPIYGLLLTFGLALIAEGIFRDQFGVSGQQYPVPELLQGATNLGFMVLPNYRAWVVLRLADGLPRHLVPDRAHAAGRLPARRHREPGAGAGLRHQRAADGDADLRAPAPAWRRSPACWPRRSSRSRR